jgi:hypothetical protein
MEWTRRNSCNWRLLWKKTKQIAALAVTPWPEEFTQHKENIKNQLTSKENNLKIQQAKEKVSKMFFKIDKNKTNGSMNKRWKDTPTHHGYRGGGGVLPLQSPGEAHQRHQTKKGTWLLRCRKLGTIGWTNQGTQNLEGIMDFGFALDLSMFVRVFVIFRVEFSPCSQPTCVLVRRSHLYTLLHHKWLW